MKTIDYDFKNNLGVQDKIVWLCELKEQKPIILMLKFFELTIYINYINILSLFMKRYKKMRAPDSFIDIRGCVVGSEIFFLN